MVRMRAVFIIRFFSLELCSHMCMNSKKINGRFYLLFHHLISRNLLFSVETKILLTRDRPEAEFSLYMPVLLGFLSHHQYLKPVTLQDRHNNVI